MSEEKKLHIDEDWKSQVDREKELWRQRQESPPGLLDAPEEPPVAAEIGTKNDLPAADERAASEDFRELPRASLTILISSLASQAMASLGQLPADDGGPMPINLPFARHFIDLLGVLEDKTRNNLSGEEATLLNNTLHHLRILFVECSRSK